jgi:hypothetical protein
MIEAFWDGMLSAGIEGQHFGAPLYDELTNDGAPPREFIKVG